MSTENMKDAITVADHSASDDQSMCETLPMSRSAAHSQKAASTEKVADTLDIEGGQTAVHSLEKGDEPLKADVARDFLVVPVPKYLRHNPDGPPRFNMFINIMFAVATTFIVANLYWCQPILIELSEAFNVSYDRVSNVPTLLQGGYAAGLLLIAPLGDLVRRRPLILLLALLSTALTFGLVFTRSFLVFQILSFLTGMVSCTPQILIPLAADLAPPHRRASAISIVVSGLLLGILVARVVSGLVAQFAAWRDVYYLAIGVQGAILAMLYALMPDFPVRNTGITYAGILGSMLRFAVTEPVLVQASLVSLASMACFTNFWVTLTFLLGGAPYHYTTLVTGLFGLIGIFGVLAAPLVGRLIDNVVPWLATMIATVGLLVFQAVQTGAGGVHVAAVVVVCLGFDVFRQMQQVSLMAAVFEIDPRARARLNSVIIIFVFLGQIMGTAVGTEVFVKYGWRPAAALSVGWTGLTLVIMLARGPHCARYTWFGYEGGLRLRKATGERGDVEKARPEAKSTVESETDGESVDEKKERVDDADADVDAGVDTKEKA